MYKTKDLMQSICRKEYSELPLEELAGMYQTQTDPAILACCFVKLFGQSLAISYGYKMIPLEDSASYCLEKLDACLLSYEKGDVKFITYFTKVFKNRLREEAESLNTHKRRANIFCDNAEEALQSRQFNDTYDCELESVLKSSQLTENEYNYCQHLQRGGTCNSDIARAMGVSVMTLSNLRKTLRKKLSLTLLQNC